MKVLVTIHAAERYQDRVKPMLTVKQASIELQALVDAGEHKMGEELGMRPGQEYVVISDGIYAPIEIDEYDDSVITSILTRAGMSSRQRKYRNEKRKTRHFARKMAGSRRVKQPYQRHNSPE